MYVRNLILWSIQPSVFINHLLNLSRNSLVQSQQWKHQGNVSNLFRVNNREARTTPLEKHLFKGGAY